MSNSQRPGRLLVTIAEAHLPEIDRAAERWGIPRATFIAITALAEARRSNRADDDREAFAAWKAERDAAQMAAGDVDGLTGLDEAQCACDAPPGGVGGSHDPACGIYEDQPERESPLATDTNRPCLRRNLFGGQSCERPAGHLGLHYNAKSWRKATASWGDNEVAPAS